MREIQEIISELDGAVARPNGEVSMDVYGGGTDESRIRATRDGFLRLGVEMMKAAFANPGDEKHPQVLDVDLGELVRDDSIIQFTWFERVESMTQPEQEVRLRDKLAQGIVVLMLLAMVVCTVIGAGTIVYWIAR